MQDRKENLGMILAEFVSVNDPYDGIVERIADPQRTIPRTPRICKFALCFRKPAEQLWSFNGLANSFHDSANPGTRESALPQFRSANPQSYKPANPQNRFGYFRFWGFVERICGVTE